MESFPATRILRAARYLSPNLALRSQEIASSGSAFGPRPGGCQGSVGGGALVLAATNTVAVLANVRPWPVDAVEVEVVGAEAGEGAAEAATTPPPRMVRRLRPRYFTRVAFCNRG